jgi:hypothetical protein
VARRRAGSNVLNARLCDTVDVAFTMLCRAFAGGQPLRNCAWLALLVASALFVTSAHAHEPGMLELTVDTIDKNLRAELDLVDLDYALSLDSGDGRLTAADVGGQRERIVEFIAGGVEVSGCRLDGRRAVSGVRTDASPSVVVDLPLACDEASKVREVTSRLFAELPDYRTVLQVKSASGTQTFALGTSAVAVPLGDSGRLLAFGSFLREGVVHILIGIDHLAFLLVLVLPIAVRGTWRAQVRSVAAIVTAFTIAHSITLALSALGHLSLPAKPVELLIAVTVVLAAVRNFGRAGSAPGWPLAYGLGLIHGFGFAGALGGLAIGEGITPLAVLAFNLGVELGQLLVIALLLPVVSVLTRSDVLGRRLVPATSLLVSGLGVFWIAERL